MNERIKELDRQIEQLSMEQYPETQYLRQVAGVGPITALCYILTLEDPSTAFVMLAGAIAGLSLFVAPLWPDSSPFS
ncbi:MAG: hypothetical protein R6T96_17060, partial [Longimicrobiales bacterium]